MGSIKVQKLSKSFGVHTVFHDVSFEIRRGERIGLIGANGAGKSTLLKCLMGEEDYDNGAFVVSEGESIGYLQQDITYADDVTLRQTITEAWQDVMKLEKDLKAVEKAMQAHPDDEGLMNRYARMQERFEWLGGYEYESMSRKIVQGLGFSEADMDRPVQSFSGGQKTRINLAKALDSGASAKITIYNRRINKAEFERSVLLPDKDDGLDEYRHEFNQMLTAQVTGTSNSIVRERYLTVSVVKRNADEARSYFARVGTDLVTHLAQLSSVAQELTLTERLHIFRDFFKGGEQAAAEFNIHEHAKRGQHFKDWFCPDSMEFSADHFKLDARYGRVLYLQDYASYIKDSFVSELCDIDRDLMLSIDILPVPTDEAARQLQSTLLGVETNVANWQRRQNANNNFAATVPYDMELQRKETKEMLDDLTTRDQRMMFGLVTLVHLADNKEQLDSDTETLYSTARKHLCQLSTLRWQQKDGLDTVLPYGLRKIQALRTLTTESTAVLIPFCAQEIMQPNGLYYGQNAVSKNMIVADRRLLLNGNSFRLGVSGSGKSMSAKEEIVQIALSTEDDILVLDPESEFNYLTEALGGEVIRISATSDTHINALDMDRAYGDERNPIVSKSEFVLSLFEQLIGDGMVTAKEKSILGRCTEQVYLPYIRNGYKGTPPTLQDFYRLLQMQPEPEAQGLALASELFITGTLNTFAQRTNVDTNARIIDYDIRELGEQLMPLGMLVTLDAIYNRVIRNWKSGKTTWIFCDEFYVLFRYEYSANFFYKLWKRIRKYNGLITGLTQNVEELLRSDTARLMLANSEFLVLLNQSATDREELAKLLNISDTQLGYITNVPAGCGLIRCAGSIVPFTNSFPKNTRLYQLMTTKPDEALR